ncbi:hydroxyethylthiazole kinase [Alteribacter natronophilus]|uniref:hydroxyethylthiazole kinase n=1 Tax=Alteribacter natronophilus TaxID=2583810 RepID=UPI00110D36C8|nr:hydroxyethylthiazole kinase [Alteribacter natronophilus]TMW73043.1 hydroxyethylthiazole kinase [Alteribacter natronophilus]
MDEKLLSLKEKIVTQSPLIHNMTNVVVTNFTANGLYALGASPVMAYAEEEVGEMAAISSGLVLNIGTLTADQVAAMHLAGRAANKHRVPVFVDPVGAGATSYRTETSRQLLEELDIFFLRGNLGEISNLAGEEVEMKGVDSRENRANAAEIAKKAAQMYRTNVVLTGETDIITDGETVYYGHNGTPELTKVTGTGCLLTSVLAAFMAVDSEAPLETAVCALGYYGIAAETAAAGSEGPGSFQVRFLDKLHSLSSTDIKQRFRYSGEEDQ